MPLGSLVVSICSKTESAAMLKSRPDRCFDAALVESSVYGEMVTLGLMSSALSFVDD